MASLEEIIKVNTDEIPADLVLKMLNWSMFCQKKSMKQILQLLMEKLQEFLKTIRVRKKLI